MAALSEALPGVVVAGNDDRAFLGHPRGLAYLAFTEMWERFSFYGMKALLVLYMVQSLLLPGHIDKIAGMAGYRAALETVFGPLTITGLASLTFGFYGGLVYFTPVLGGLIADRLLGARRTVVIGAGLMSCGHFAMAFEQSFLVALLLLVIGSGCLKGNISSQIGHLYPRSDDSRRTRAFTIFSTGINIGATLGPLICGLMAQVYGWDVGFGIAGVMMVVATAIYLAGQRHLPDIRPRRRIAEPSPALTKDDWRRIWLLLAVMAISMFQTITYDQCFNIGMIWISGHVDLATPIGRVPVAWFTAIDSFASIVAAAALIVVWRWQAARGTEPGDIAKIGIGAALAAGSAALLAFGAWLSGDGKTSAFIPLMAFVGMGFAFIYYWPPLLGLVCRSAPPQINSTMMGLAFTSIFIADMFMGWAGTFYERMSPPTFWALHAALAAIGALIVAAFGRSLDRALRTALD